MASWMDQSRYSAGVPSSRTIDDENGYSTNVALSLRAAEDVGLGSMRDLLHPEAAGRCLLRWTS